MHLSDCRAVHRHISPSIAKMFLLLSCTSSGMFTSATSLLPSTFTMYTLTLAAAAMLNSDHRRVVLYAMVGVIWGWAVAGVAFLPYAVLLLLVGAPTVYLSAGIVFLIGTLAPMIAFDRLFYGTWTVSCNVPETTRLLPYACLLTCLLACLLPCLPACLLPCLLACLHASLHACMLACLVEKVKWACTAP